MDQNHPSRLESFLAFIESYGLVGLAGVSLVGVAWALIVSIF